jgi:hypothetical protein
MLALDFCATTLPKETIVITNHCCPIKKEAKLMASKIIVI